MATIGTITQAPTALFARMSVQATITADSVAATVVANQTFTVPGLTTDMIISVEQVAPATNACCIGGRVSSADTLQLTYINPTAAGVTPTAGTYKILAF